MHRRQILAAALAAPAVILGSRTARALEPVDVELILAVDVSRSVDSEEQEMQFNGYAAAFRDQRLIEAMMRGPVGSIACTFFTWSDWNIQEHLVPWTKLDGPESAEQFARAIDAAPRRTHLYTSISGAMDFAAGLYGQGYEGTRRVIDISGDGINNSGREVGAARADLLNQGVVVNGLAVLDRTPPPPGLGAMQPLDEYYQERVIGGPGAFLMVADGFESFEQAVRRKIIREVASIPAHGPLVERATA
jgi:hypothetical protein